MRYCQWSVVLAVLVASASPVLAQDVPEEEPAAIQFLPRYTFQMTAEHLSGDDPQRIWEANYGGQLDLIDYGAGRLTFTANYEVILGEEIRIFDPNQSTYLLEMSASRRVLGAEFAGVFHHISRHLSDRAKIDPLDWNMVGIRAMASTNRNRLSLQTQAHLLGVIQRSFVDYMWEARMNADARVAVNSRFVVLSKGGLRVLGVDGSANRGTQIGFRIEGGVSLEGEAGAIELFAAVERRVDPMPFKASIATVSTLGFRLVGR
jgi:hypothetical protein